jgi:hypothetical protein
MPTTNKGLDQPALNATNWNTPLNTNFGILDDALGGRVTKSVTGVGTTPVVLTASEYQKLALIFTGVLTANVTYQIPSGIGGQWQVVNSTSGAFTLTISSGGGGASVVVATGGRRIVFSDGTGVFPSDNSVAAVGTANSVAYSNGTALTGSTGFTYDGTKVSVTATTAATNAETEVLRLDAQSSGTPAAGSGPLIAFASETAAGVTKIGGQMAIVAADVATGTEDFDFVLRLMAAGANASEIMRVTSAGALTVGGNAVLTSRSATGTAVQSLIYAGITATADADGTISSGTYTPTPVGGNFKTITNGGAFTLAAPTADGDYTLVVLLSNSATSGAVTLSGFTKTTGGSFTTTSTSRFVIYITKIGGFTVSNVIALQ